MSQEWYRDFDRRRSQRVSSQWRSHNQAAGKRRLIGGSVTALAAIILLILGANHYVEAVYSNTVGDPTFGVGLMALAGVLVVVAIVLATSGYLRRRQELNRVRTYDDLG